MRKSYTTEELYAYVYEGEESVATYTTEEKEKKLAKMTKTFRRTENGRWICIGGENPAQTLYV